jgi:hypothetical protein
VKEKAFQALIYLHRYNEGPVFLATVTSKGAVN